MARDGLLPAMAISKFPATGGIDRRTCRHPELAYLGKGGRAAYYRCRACGAGVIDEGGRFWVLRPGGS